MNKSDNKYFQMSKCQSFYAASSLIISLSIIFLFTAIGKNLLAWINSNGSLASWVQAVGSIGAIVAIACISRVEIKNRNRTESEAAYRKISIAYSILRLSFNRHFSDLKHEALDFEPSFLRAQINIIKEAVRVLSSIQIENLHGDWAKRSVSSIIISQELISHYEMCLDSLRNGFPDDEDIENIAKAANEILKIRDEFNDYQRFLSNNLNVKHMSYSPSELLSAADFPNID